LHQSENARSAGAPRIKENVEAAVRVGLQDAGEVLQMPLRMFAALVGRGVIDHRRRRAAAEGPVIVHVAPDPRGHRLALRQDRQLNEYLRHQSGMPTITGQSAIAGAIDRIDVYKDRLAVRLRSRESPGPNSRSHS
jgi:hypothetical protein